MEIGSSVVTPRPGPPGGFSYDGDSGADWVGACLIKAFPIDPPALPALGWSSGRTAAPSPAERDLVRSSPKRTRTPKRAAGPAPKKPAAKAPAERRSEDRSTVSVYRSAMVHWDSVEALCLVRNVSSGGMMGKVLIDLPIGTPILVEMRSGHEIPGQVIWSQNKLVGVQFDTSIDVQHVMNGTHRVMHNWRQRMPRVHVPCPVTLLTSSGRQTVTLLDLSQGGAKIEGDLLREGDDVTLAVKGLDPHRGTVRWACGGRAGIAFLAAIPFDALALWALDRQAELGRIASPPAPSANSA